MDGSAFSGIGELIKGLYIAGVVLLGLTVSLAIMLVLTICFGWSWFFLLIIPPVLAILGVSANKLVN